MCEHEHFVADVNVGRITKSEGGPVAGFSAEVHIRCLECDEPFVFVGAPVGLLPSRPAMSPEGTEIRLPIRPQSSDPHFGLGLAGYEARIREARPEGHN